MGEIVRMAATAAAATEKNYIVPRISMCIYHTKRMKQNEKRNKIENKVQQNTQRRMKELMIVSSISRMTFSLYLFSYCPLTMGIKWNELNEMQTQMK